MARFQILNVDVFSEKITNLAFPGAMLEGSVQPFDVFFYSDRHIHPNWRNSNIYKDKHVLLAAELQKSPKSFERKMRKIGEIIGKIRIAKVPLLQSNIRLIFHNAF